MRHLPTCVHSSIVHNSQKVPTQVAVMGEWVMKIWQIHIREYYSALKKEGNSEISCSMEKH